MTKRYGSYQVTNGKKPKLDEDDVWDDDLDAEAIDKCFELASQVANDVSILPTYNTFKNPSGFTSSTQGIASGFPSTTKTLSGILPTYNAFKNPSAFTSSTQGNAGSFPSTSKSLSMDELHCEIQRLKQQSAEKEGEISVLRSKIKESTVTVQVEKQKSTNQWREQLHVSQKEVKSVRSDLEFKNLEVANLKQQLAELRRINNLDSTLNNTQTFIAPQPVVANHERTPKPKDKEKYEDKLLQYKEAILEPIFPLKTISPKIFEDTIKERHMIKNTSYQTSRNTIPYLQNQQTYNEGSFNHKCPRLNNKQITLENVYPDILKLVNCNLEEINSRNCVETINKIICVTLILLKDLNDYLVELGSHLRAEDVQQSDVNYLLNEGPPLKSTIKSQNLQLGIQASKILEVTSRLVRCNPYTAGFICRDEPLKLLPANKEYAKQIPHRDGAVQNDYYLLRLVVTIVSNIGPYRLTKQTNDFLLSVINLLESIALLDNTSHMVESTVSNEVFCKSFKEVIFARPGHEAIERITFLLKVCSRHKAFVRYLFKKNGHNELLKAGPRGVLYYKKDVCSFCVLAILLQNYALRTESLPLEVCYNMLSFINNTFKTSHWIHHENEENVCVCLSQLYKLEIDFAFRGIAEFVKHYGDKRHNFREISEEWSSFLKYEIIQKVLNQMNFNNFELTEKYVIIYSQFKEIEKTLRSEGLFNVTQLNVSEELLKVSTKSFGKDF